MLTDSSTKKHIVQGTLGENRVAEYLKAQGYSIITVNYKKKYGEIDIIALKDSTLAFVEVKTRTKSSHCSSELVNTAKQRKIVRVAKEYISTKNIVNCSIRFDVALLDQQKDTILYIENAFYGAEYD
jgi:putative endonuclease